MTVQFLQRGFGNNGSHDKTMTQKVTMQNHDEDSPINTAVVVAESFQVAQNDVVVDRHDGTTDVIENHTVTDVEVV